MRPFPDQHDDPRVVSGMRAQLRERARRLRIDAPVIAGSDPRRAAEVRSRS